MDRIDVKCGFECNNRCRFCVQGDKRYEYGNKSTDEIKQTLAEGRKDADQIVFTGGEVTIRPDFPELVAHAKSLGFKVIQLQSNGRALASMEYARKVRDAGITEFSPAIHGPNPEIHDYLVNAPGAFKQTVKGVLNAKQLGLPVILNSVITLVNYRHLPAMARLFVSLHVDQYQFAFVHALGSAAKNWDEIVPRFRDIEPFVKEGLQVGIDAGVRVMTEAIPLCILSGYERYAAEFIIPRTKVFDANWTVDDYTKFRITEGKAKAESCRSCRHDPYCEGPWREYPERFGFEEFVPVPKPGASAPAPTEDLAGGKQEPDQGASHHKR